MHKESSNQNSKLTDPQTGLTIFPRYEIPSPQASVNKLTLRTFERILDIDPSLLPALHEFAQFDPETFGHSLSVAHVAENAYREYAQQHGLEENENATIFFLAGLFHDIGKTGIDKRGSAGSKILLYPERRSGNHITPDELRVIRAHDEIGGRMLKHILKESNISKEVATPVILLTNTHHGKLPPSPLSKVDRFRSIFFTLCDCAVTTREWRSFCPEARSLTIESLLKYVPPELIINEDGQVKNDVLKEIIELIMGVTYSIDPILRNQPTSIPEEHRDGKKTTTLRNARQSAWDNQ